MAFISSRWLQNAWTTDWSPRNLNLLSYLSNNKEMLHIVTFKKCFNISLSAWRMSQATARRGASLVRGTGLWPRGENRLTPRIHTSKLHAKKADVRMQKCRCDASLWDVVEKLTACSSTVMVVSRCFRCRGQEAVLMLRDKEPLFGSPFTSLGDVLRFTAAET